MTDQPSQELETMTDDELKLRFFVEAGVAIEGEALVILHTLTKRGYLYDVKHRDFLTCEEWNQRYSYMPPMHCD